MRDACVRAIELVKYNTPTRANKQSRIRTPSMKIDEHLENHISHIESLELELGLGFGLELDKIIQQQQKPRNQIETYRIF